MQNQNLKLKNTNKKIILDSDELIWNEIISAAMSRNTRIDAIKTGDFNFISYIKYFLYKFL